MGRKIHTIFLKIFNLKKKLLYEGGSPGELSEELVTWEKRKKGWRMSCDVGEVTERLENELCYDYNYEFC